MPAGALTNILVQVSCQILEQDGWFKQQYYTRFYESRYFPPIYLWTNTPAHIPTSAHTYTHIHTHKHIWCMRTYRHPHPHSQAHKVHAHTYTHTNTHKHIRCTRTHTHTITHTHTQAHKVHAYTYTHTNTHTQTHTQIHTHLHLHSIGWGTRAVHACQHCQGPWVLWVLLPHYLRTGSSMTFIVLVFVCVCVCVCECVCVCVCHQGAQMTSIPCSKKTEAMQSFGRLCAIINAVTHRRLVAVTHRRLVTSHTQENSYKPHTGDQLLVPHRRLVAVTHRRLITSHTQETSY